MCLAWYFVYIGVMSIVLFLLYHGDGLREGNILKGRAYFVVTPEFGMLKTQSSEHAIFHCL